MAFVFIMAMWLMFLALHEYAHARVAYAGGDTTVADKGYLTLNPFRFTSFTMSVLFPLLFLAIGGIPLPGGCVYVDKSRLRSRHWEALVAGAGVAAEVAAVPLLMLPLWLGWADPAQPFWSWYSFFVFLIVYSIVLNLLPVPPLDGYGLIEPFLPRELRDFGDSVKPYGLFVVIGIVLLSNAAGFPILNFTVGLLSILLGLDLGLVREGSVAMNSV